MFHRHHRPADGAMTDSAEGRRKGLRRAMRGTALSLGAVLVFSVTTIMTASAVPDALDADTHQGQEKVDGVLGDFTNGNVTEYAELDTINFRFTLRATDEGTGVMAVRFTDGIGECEFFDGTFVLGAIENVSGAIPIVTVGSISQDGPAGEFVQLLNVDFDSAGVAIVNYTLRLTDEAGDCNGASQHSRLQTVSGDFKTIGAQNVPVPANQVLELPDITVTKQIDRDGDGSFEDTADAGEFCFELDNSGVCVPTDASGQVVFTSVTPDGDHTITEEQLVFTQGVFEFDSGSGTNCAFTDDVATATVAADNNDPTNAECVFNNAAAAASLTVTKVVTNDNGGDAVVADFPLFIDGSQVTSGVANVVSPGAHTVTETNLSGYTPSIGGDCAADGTISLLPGESAECIITNDDQPASLTVTKIVINDNGGDAVVADFPLFVNGNPVTSGVANTLNAGDYTVSETNLPGYSATIGGDCAADGTINLDPGETAECTITNNDVAPELGRIVVRKVADEYDTDREFPFSSNFDGDANDGADFSLEAGEELGFDLAPGTYSVNELIPDGWDLVSAVCSDQSPVNAILLGAGETVICTFTNEQEANDYDQYPGDNDFDFDTPFDDAGDPGTPTPTTDTAGTNDQTGTQAPAAPAPQPAIGNNVVENNVTVAQPDPAAPVALDQLPRTGQGIERMTMLGGLLMIVGGMAVMAGRRRREHKA